MCVWFKKVTDYFFGYNEIIIKNLKCVLRFDF